MEIWKRNLLVCWLGVFATSTGLSQLTPILPLYIEQLGVHDLADIEQWSGITYGVTFVCMALFSPLWGRAADKYGRKPMLLRASLGMAIVVTSMGFAQSVYQLAGLRLLQGTISGFYSASITLVATQAPGTRLGWALGTLSTAALAGMLIGPLFGGYLAESIGIRSMFWVIGIMLLFAFTASLLFVKENFIPAASKTAPGFKDIWLALPNKKMMAALLVTTLVLSLALTSIQPIITVYISELTEDKTHVALISGLVFATAGLSSILAAPALGRLSDKIGPQKVMLASLAAAGFLCIPQAFVDNHWELAAWRFLLGIATAGLLPSINTLIKQISPDEVSGSVFGYNQSAQFIGAFAGSVMGGGIAALWGIPNVFLLTSALLIINAFWLYKTMNRDRTACS